MVKPDGEHLPRRQHWAWRTRWQSCAISWGVDVWEVITSGRPVSPSDTCRLLIPAPVSGGHCIPVDPLYLSWKMKTAALQLTVYSTCQLRLNAYMPHYVMDKITNGLNDDGQSRVRWRKGGGSWCGL